MASSPPSDVEQEKADQQQRQSPPPPMAAPVWKPDPFSYDSVIMLPGLVEQLFMSAIEKQENPQERGTDDEDVADGLLRLSLEDDPVTEDAKVGDEGGGDLYPPAVDEGTSTMSPKLKRGERKNRNTLEKLGMQHVTGVCKVTMLAKSEKQKILISFLKPDVFKFSNLESYAIFGEGSSEARLDLLPQEADDEYVLDEYDELTDEEDEVDETGIPPGDVDIVMEEAGVSRRAAVKALKRRGGDVVLAIMDLDPPSE